MSNRATIYIPPEVSEAIGRGGDLSARLACIVDRHRQFVDDNMPEMAERQWCAVMDANIGTDWIVPISPGGVWANVCDSPGLGDKWGIDQEELIDRLRSMTASELLAITEVCHRFWSEGNNEPTHLSALLRAGARVKGK